MAEKIKMNGLIVPPDIDRIMGHDESGYYILTRGTIHTDGTPDEWEKTYYTPFDVACGLNVRQISLDECIPDMMKRRGFDGGL